jgi:hypothetical protein
VTAAAPPTSPKADAPEEAEEPAGEDSPDELSTDDGLVQAPAATWRERLEERGIDRDTVPILLLILVHVVVSLGRAGLTLYALPIVLWFGVGAGVVIRQTWSLALALLLVCLELAFALFGIAPRTVQGLPSWAPIDFVMIAARIVTGLMIWRLQDQLE